MEIEGYTLGRALGRGATATVFEARGQGERVAIKVYSQTRSLEPGARRRMQAELATLSRLEHPGIVRLRSAGEVQGQLYVVMDLIEGETLQARLTRGPLGQAEARELVRALAVALDYVHRCGVLHRDLKPDNVLLDGLGVPRITDFGLARDLEDERARLTATGALLGTPGYLAPEQASGLKERVGTPADVYGLGGILYACLTGVPPVEGASLPEVLAATAQGRITSPRALRPELDRELERVCLRCLALEPGARPSAQELARSLAREGSSRGARGRRRLLAAVGLVAALLGGAWVLALRRPGPRTPPPERLAAYLAAWEGATSAQRRAGADALVDEFPAAAAGYVQRARIAISSPTDWDEARGWIDAALAREPDHGDALALAATIYRAQEDHAGLTALYARAVELDPLRFLRARALYLQGQGDLEGAERDLRGWLALEPESELPWLGLARLARDRERWAESIDAYAQCLRVAPADANGQVHRERGLVRLKAKRYEGAIADLERAAELRGEWDLGLRAGYADALTGALRYPEAAQAYREALAIYPRQVLWVYTLSQLEQALGHPEEALRLLERAYELSQQRGLHPSVQAEIEAAWRAAQR